MAVQYVVTSPFGDYQAGQFVPADVADGHPDKVVRVAVDDAPPPDVAKEG